MAERLIWGVVLVVVGLLLLAANFGYIPPFSVWDLWPVLVLVPALRLTFAGIGRAWMTLEGRRRSFRVPVRFGVRLVGLWLGAGATAELLNNVGLSRYGWGAVASWTLPLLLVALGLEIIARSGRTTRWSHGEVLREPSAEKIWSFVGDLRFGARPWTFRSPMRIDLWAGDVDVDLTTASLPTGDSYLSVQVWAGEVSVRVPDDVEVHVEAYCSLGRVHVLGTVRDGYDLVVKESRPALRPGGSERRLFIGVQATMGDICVR
ncbi:MAG: cell wall-active antibiotics response protein [Firmicutes bacterium]|nr:cell wall-active antibiotics response protein [Bacillota bacterium]